MVPADFAINQKERNVKRALILIDLAENKGSEIWQKGTCLKPTSVIATKTKCSSNTQSIFKKLQTQLIAGVSNENNRIH